MIWNVIAAGQHLGIVNEPTREQAQSEAEAVYGWTRDQHGRQVRRAVKVQPCETAHQPRPLH